MNYSVFASNLTHQLFDEFSSTNLKNYTTKKYYLSELNHLLDHFEKDAFAITEKNAESYLEFLVSRMTHGDITYETMTKKIKQLSSIYHYFLYESMNRRIPAEFTDPFSAVFVEEPNYYYAEKDILSYEHINAFFNYVSTQSKRDYLLCQILYFSLQKPSVLVDLKKDALVSKEGEWYLRLVIPTSRKVNIIKLPTVIGMETAKYANSHSGESLFVNKSRNPLKIRTLQNNLLKYSNAFGLGKNNITASKLYHAGIFHALKKGMDKTDLKEQLAISDEKYLDRYILAEPLNVSNVVSSCDYIEVRIIQ